MAAPSIVRGSYESLLVVGTAKRMLRNEVEMSVRRDGRYGATQESTFKSR